MSSRTHPPGGRAPYCLRGRQVLAVVIALFKDGSDVTTGASTGRQIDVLFATSEALGTHREGETV
jgi:hypothetical protein